MVAGAFPIVKLGTLAIRQLSKPLANAIKKRAKSSHFFRTYICMPPAQFYHWVEVNIKMKMLNLGKPTEVPKLNENMAIELGAELLGEAIIFTTAALTIIGEYIRQTRKEALKESQKEERHQEIERAVEELQFRIEQQEAEIRHLNRLYYSLENRLTHCEHQIPECESSKKKKGIITKAIEDASKTVKGK